MLTGLNRIISDKDAPVFIVAELSANHNKDMDIVRKTVKAASEAGADAIKLQTYTPDTITIDCNNEYFQIKQGTIWDGQTLYQLYEKAYMPWEWQPEIKEYAEELGLVCFSTPFDKSAVDFLERMDVPAYKVASFEITDIPLIEYVASKGKPVILSTGIASLSDMEEAIVACKRVGNNQIIILKCTSEYPTPLEEINLKTIPNMADTFRVPVGLSDHTLGCSVAVTSIAFGVKIIEKHIIFDREIGGPDAAFSVEPLEFKRMVQLIREAEKSLGCISYEPSEKVKNNKVFFRSLFVVEYVKQGEIFTEKNVRSIRPGNGLHPKHLKEIIGKKAKQDISSGTPLSWSIVD